MADLLESTNDNNAVVMSGECAACGMPGEMSMSALPIAQTDNSSNTTTSTNSKQMLVYSFSCSHCGHQQRDVKYTAGISKKGQKITMTISKPEHLIISLVHSAQCDVSIPSVDLDFQGGPTAGTYCTLRDVINGVYEDVKNNPCLSSVKGPEALQDFLDKIKTLDRTFPWDIIFDDRDSNSFIESKGDAKIVIEEYEKDEFGRRRPESIQSTLSADEKLKVLGGTVSLKAIAEKILRGEIKNIVTLSGAGISTNAGIPDWRSNKGIYSVVTTDPDQHTLEKFREDPTPVLRGWKLFVPLMQGKLHPTKAHRMIRQLNDKGILKKCYTQNIDSLEKRAGIPSDKLVQAHGSLDVAMCIDCGWNCPEDEMQSNFWSKIDQDIVPTCPKCKSTTCLKPKVVFFGETLPEVYFNSVNEDFQKCDLLIVIGTSLKVHPFAGLVDTVKETTPRLLINKECVGTFQYGVKQNTTGIYETGLPGTYRDVAFIGDIDEGVELLLSYLGWTDT